MPLTKDYARNFGHNEVADLNKFGVTFASHPDISSNGTTDVAPMLSRRLVQWAAAGVELVIVNNFKYVIGTNLTIPVGIILRVEPGALLEIASGITLTTNGIEAKRHQIFSGSGTVSMVAGTQDSVMPEWWGGKPDNGTTDNQLPLERAIATSLPIDLAAGTYVVKKTITVARDTRMSLFGGRGQQFKTNETSGGSIIKFSPTTTPDLMFDATAGHLFLSLRDVVFTTNDNTTDPTVANSFIEVAVPGAASTLQGSLEAPFDISGSAFRFWGGTVLGLYGEMFGVIERNYFHKCAQAIRIDGVGEIAFRSNNFEVGANDSYADTGDAYILINKTVVKFVENVFNMGPVDRRHTIRFNSCKATVFQNNKMERSGLTASSKHELFFDADTAIVAYSPVITGNSFVRSSLSNAAHTGRFINFATSVDSSSFRGAHIEGNSFLHSPNSPASVPCIDFSGCVDSSGAVQVADCRIGINYWENGDSPLVKLPAFVVAQGSINDNMPLYGFTFDDADMISEVSTPLTLSATQTGTTVPFHGANFPRAILTSTRGQLVPVSLAIETDKATGDTLTMFISGPSSDLITSTDQPLVRENADGTGRTVKAFQFMAATAQDAFNGEIPTILKYNSGASFDATMTIVIYLHVLIFKHASNKRVIDVG